MLKGIFITGTDTGVGKTLITGLLGRYLKEKGKSVITQKWVQTGCSGVSEDIETHLKIMGINGTEINSYIGKISPYVLTYPASPHLAAERDRRSIDPVKIIAAYDHLADKFDHVLVEGSGGWLVPVSRTLTSSEIVKDMSLSVLIVAENRLGAVNQTLMTIESIKNRGLDVIGVIFNRVSDDGDEYILEDNKKIVSDLTGVQVLGELPFLPDISELYEKFTLIGEKYVALIGG